MRRPRKLRVLSHITTKIKHVNLVKVLSQMLARAVEREVIHKAVIGNESNDPFVANAVAGPADCLDLRIGK